MKITIKTGKATIVAVKVPSCAEMFSIKAKTNILRFLIEDVSGSSGEPNFSTVELPSGKYQILGKPEEITEEVAAEITERVKQGWIVYNKETGWYCGSAVQSFLSLLTANKVEGNDYVLIKLIDK